MIPVLFEKDETAFTRLGIGALTDCVTVTVKRVLNGQDELALTYPDNGIRVQELQNSRIIFAQPEYKKPSQPYVIYQVSKPVRGLITVYARHIRERASFIPVMPFTASSLADTLMKIDDYCAETSPFSYWTDKTVTANFKLETPASLGNVLGGMEGSILDTYGGEYEFDNFLVKIWNRRGVDRGVTLRYGKNVTDATQEESIDSTITGICPFWTDGEDVLVTLPEKVVHSQNAANFPFNRTIPKDFSEQFENQPTEAQLRTAAQSYIGQAGIGVPKVSLSVSFEQLAQYAEYQDVAVLETVNLGDTVTVIFERLEVDATARVVQTEYDVLNEKYRRISIGGVKSNLGTTINGVVQEAKTEARDTRTSLQRSIDRATEMLTGANGGYLVDIFDANGQRTGDMIMDTNNPATATNVWLRNLAGWGYSSTGVNGQYRTAITQDGHIVADFIDTGTLTANIIKTGMLKSSYNNENWWNLATGEIHVGIGGTIGGWEIDTNMIKRDITSGSGDNAITYSPRLYAPEYPSANTSAFYIKRTQNGEETYPFRVRYNGALEATDATISGDITATSLTLGANVTIPYGKINNAPDLTVYIAKDGTVGHTPAQGVDGFKVSSAGLLTASNAVIYGTLYASGGSVAGWNIDGYLIYKDQTESGGTIHRAQMRSGGTYASTNTAFSVRSSTDDGETWTSQFNVTYGGTIRAVGGGTIGAWTLTAGEASSSSPTQGSLYSGMSTLDSTSNGVYIGYDGIALGGGKFKVTRAGALTATSGNFTGNITGSTITSTAEKTFIASNYSNSDVTTVSNIILGGGYPTATQLNKYDFNQDGIIDVSDVAVLNNIVNNATDYNIKTVTTISPTDSNSPMKIQFGGAAEGTSISMSNGTIIGAKYIRSGSFLALNSSGTVTGAFTSEGLMIYDSSRRLRARLDSSGLYFYNTSGTVTNSYPA